MDPRDPVDAAALSMYNETRAYLEKLRAGEEHPDPEAMSWATAVYADAVFGHLMAYNSQEDEYDPRLHGL